MEDWRTGREEALVTVAEAMADREEAMEQLRVQNEFLRAEAVRAELERGQYEDGLLSFQEWGGIENDLINNEQSVLARQRETVIARANADKARGVTTIPW